MLTLLCRNARAEECSAPGTGVGAMTVRYQGAEYAVIGVYFTTHRGRHEICYVLRPTLAGGEDVATAQPDGCSPSRLRISPRGALSCDLRGMG